MNDERDRGPGHEAEHAAPAALPEAWLPEALPPEGHPAWELRARRIIAAAEPELARLEREVGPPATPWLSELGGWWKPAALLAAAASALLFVTADPPPPDSPAFSSEGMALTLIASDGDPTALWAALGVPADPVLALLTLQDHSALAPPRGAAPPPEGESR
jgi:hypothetical protein